MAPLLMQVLRERSRSTIIYFLFAILIIVFVFTFNTSGSGGGCSPTGVAGLELANVDGKPIDIGMVGIGEALTPDFPRPAGVEFLPEELRMQYERPSQYSRFYYLSSFPLSLVLDPGLQRPVDSPEFKNEPNARYAFFRRDLTQLDSVKRIRVMNDLVESYLVAAEARNMGLAVGEKEINDRFFFVPPAYRPDEDVNNVPTAEQFNEYLRRLGASPTNYRQLIENELLREKVIDVLANLATVSNQEVEIAHADTQEGVAIEYIEVNAEQLAKIVAVTEKEIAAVAADKETLEAEYKKRESQYQQKKKVAVRALLVEAPDETATVAAGSAEETARNEALKKANALVAQLKATTVAPTPEPAKTEETAKPVEPVKADDETEKAAEPAEAAGTEKPAETKTVEAPALAEAAPKEAVKPSFDDVQKKFIELVKSASTDDSKSNDGLYPGTMNALYLELRFGKEVAKSAYALEKGQFTEPVLGKRGYWILFVDDLTPENVRSLEDVTPELARELAQKKKAEEWAPAVAKDILARAQKSPKTDLSTIAEEWNRANQPALPGGPEEAAPPEDVKEKPAAEADKTAEATPPTKEAEASTEEETEEEPLDFPGMLRRYQVSLHPSSSITPPIWGYPKESGKTEGGTSTYSDEDDSWATIDGILPSSETDTELKVSLLKLSKDFPVHNKIHEVDDGKRSFILRYAEAVKPSEESANKDDIRNTLLAHRQLEAYRAWYAALLGKALEDGTVELTDEWHQFVTTAWDNEQQQLQRKRKKQNLSLGQ